MKPPRWLDEQDALTVHDRLLSLHGGAPGLRDLGLLKSALARPRQYLAYSPDADAAHLAALHTVGIIRNHPFVDGNKRMAFVIGVLFLELNGYRFRASEEDSATAVVEAAAGALDETGYAAFLRDSITVAS
jgi:death-on-curing protein